MYRSARWARQRKRFVPFGTKNHHRRGTDACATNQWLSMAFPFGSPVQTTLRSSEEDTQKFAPPKPFGVRLTSSTYTPGRASVMTNIRESPRSLCRPSRTARPFGSVRRTAMSRAFHFSTPHRMTCTVSVKVPRS